MTRYGKTLYTIPEVLKEVVDSKSKQNITAATFLTASSSSSSEMPYTTLAPSQQDIDAGIVALLDLLDLLDLLLCCYLFFSNLSPFLLFLFLFFSLFFSSFFPPLDYKISFILILILFSFTHIHIHILTPLTLSPL